WGRGKEGGGGGRRAGVGLLQQRFAPRDRLQDRCRAVVEPCREVLQARGERPAGSAGVAKSTSRRLGRPLIPAVEASADGCESEPGPGKRPGVSQALESGARRRGKGHKLVGTTFRSASELEVGQLDARAQLGALVMPGESGFQGPCDRLLCDCDLAAPPENQCEFRQQIASRNFVRVQKRRSAAEQVCCRRQIATLCGAKPSSCQALPGLDPESQGRRVADVQLVQVAVCLLQMEADELIRARRMSIEPACEAFVQFRALRLRQRCVRSLADEGVLESVHTVAPQLSARLLDETLANQRREARIYDCSPFGRKVRDGRLRKLPSHDGRALQGGELFCGEAVEAACEKEFEGRGQRLRFAALGGVRQELLEE